MVSPRPDTRDGPLERRSDQTSFIGRRHRRSEHGRGRLVDWRDRGRGRVGWCFGTERDIGVGGIGHGWVRVDKRLGGSQSERVGKV